jgi:hypothetical protein
MNRYLATVGTSDDCSAVHFQVTQECRQVIRLEVPGGCRGRASIASTVISDGVKVFAEFGPDLVPRGRMKDAIVKQYHSLRGRPAFLKIYPRSLDREERTGPARLQALWPGRATPAQTTQQSHPAND